MNSKWSEVDNYILDRLVPRDEVLEAALEANKQAGLPPIDVAPNQGKLLHLLARMMNARHILEIGTLGGYSTIWMARALPPDGRLVTLEANARHAEVAQANIRRAGLQARVKILVGPALESLPTLETGPAFDLIFIDADKPNNPNYLSWALKLSHPGTVIIGDNVVREGAVIDPESSDDNVQGTRLFFDRLHSAPGLTATAIQTVGAKGWDGFAIAIVE